MSWRPLLYYIRRDYQTSYASPRRSIAAAVAVLVSFIPSGGADTYSQWKARVFSEAEQADPNISGENVPSPAGDGIPNLLKYAFSLDPHQDGSLALPTISLAQIIDPASGLAVTYPSISYRVSSTDPPSDLYFVPELSFDLQTWIRGDSVFGPPDSQSGTNLGDPALVTSRALWAVASHSKAFLRLRVLEGQSLPDDWQMTRFGHTGVDATGDEDLDGRSNFDEFLHGTDPNDYYDGKIPVLQIVSGDRQKGFASRLLPFPLVIRVTYGGVPLTNAPVRFSISQGAAQLSSSPNVSPQNVIDVRTDENGMASAYVFFGSASNDTKVVDARSANQTKSFVETAIAPEVPKLAAGGSHSLELDPDGVVWLWGDNSYGELGDGTTDFRNAPFANLAFGNAVDIAAGLDHSVIAEFDGTVQASGSNWAGQLGDGTTDDQTTPVTVTAFSGAIAVSAGAYHTLALRADGTVWAWGYNGEGELGNGTTDWSASPVEVVTESGSPLQDVIAIACGQYHNLALKSDGTVWAWGANWSGNLGDGTYDERHYAIQVPGLSNIRSIKAGAYHSLALENGADAQARRTKSNHPQSVMEVATCWAWGANFSSQLGNGTYQDSIVPTPIVPVGDIVALAAGFSNTLALTSDGRVWGWGSNWNGEVTGEPSSPLEIAAQVPGIASIISIASGELHSLGLASNGLIYAWGRNRNGQLGVGNEDDQNAPVTTAKSTNRSGMPDAWQMYWFGRTGVNPNGDEDGDGLTNLEEYKLGTFPNNAYSDGDDVPDGEDGWPLDGDLHPPRLPERSYALVDLGEGIARAINNNNEVAGDRGKQGFIWRNGSRQDLPERGDATYAVGINDNGTALFNSDNAGPAVWAEDHFVELTTGIDDDIGTVGQRRIVGWDPNIVWIYVRLNWSTAAAINNAGHLAANIFGNSSHISPPSPKGWPAIWSSADDSTAVPLYATPDENDRILNVDDSRDDGFASDYQHTAQSFNFGGHYDNSLGVDDNTFVAAINNQDQSVGGCLHYTGVDSQGFPATVIINGVGVPQRGTITFWTNGQPEDVATGDKGGQSLNDDGVIIGQGTILDQYGRPDNHTMLWIKVNGEWKEKDLGVSNSNDVRRINRNIQIISGGLLYQNGHAVDLASRIPADYVNLQAIGINEAGLIIGRADVDSGNGTLRTHAVLLSPADLLTDYNRDGKIDEHDKNLVTEQNPYRFWVNDDNDSGETDGDDIPGYSAIPNYDDDIVNGVRDLIDFFPVFVDIKGLLAIFPAGQNAVYKLKQADGALNFIETELTPTSVGPFLTNVGVANNIATKTVQRITSAGVALSEQFLGSIKDGGRGVVLLEGRAFSDKPLILEVTNQYGNKLAKLELPIRISGVEQMYRHFNMMSADGAFGGRLTEMREPANYPDSLCSDKTFVFVHGFFVSADGARGWNAEIFKRMYWAGSRAKFVGVTWHSDEKNGTTIPDYHKNVDNAFATASSFAALVRYLGPNITVAAHSLGNVVVGSGIQDWGATPANYFMIDAAVPMEAYDGGTATDDAMIHPDWINYRSAADPDHPVPDRLFASEWYLDPAFPAGDGRKNLTWRDRLGKVGTNTYNFYSSTEDVLRKHEGDPGFFTDTLWTQILHGGLYTWCLQEKLKGHQVEHNVLGVVDAKIGSTYGGWQLTANFYNPPEQPHTPTPSEAAARSDDSFLIEPIFDPGFSLRFSTPDPSGQTKFVHNQAPSWIIDLTGPAKGSATAQAHRNQLLAEMFPARTLPAGANYVGKFAPPTKPDRNFNMPDLYTNGWPQERGSNIDWRHSDFKAVGYTYIYPLYDELVGILTEKP